MLRPPECFCGHEVLQPFAYLRERLLCFNFLGLFDIPALPGVGGFRRPQKKQGIHALPICPALSDVALLKLSHFFFQTRHTLAHVKQRFYFLKAVCDHLSQLFYLLV